MHHHTKRRLGLRTLLGAVLAVGLAAVASAQTPPADAPSASISNGVVNAKLWLPDTEKGYYRSTRFDWSGSVWSLETGGHSYFGQWFPKYDAMAHGNITGPVEDYAPLNYAEAKPGENFVKIGVGVLKKIDDTPYRFATLYDVLDHGKWTTRAGKDFVEYTHVLNDPKSGYGYVYTKTVSLTPGKPQMVIEHTLKNTGAKPIATNNYNHGFFMLDGQPIGPDTSVTFPFAPKAERSMAPAAETRGQQIVYLQELQMNANALAAAGVAPGAAPPGPTGASSNISGFSLTDAKDFDIRVENKKTGAGVRFTSDKPLWKINFWSVRSTVCPEAYVEVKAEPGKETKWRLTYDFYSLPK
jgi:hypothetical protein